MRLELVMVYVSVIPMLRVKCENTGSVFVVVNLSCCSPFFLLPTPHLSPHHHRVLLLLLLLLRSVVSIYHARGVPGGESGRKTLEGGLGRGRFGAVQRANEASYGDLGDPGMLGWNGAGMRETSVVPPPSSTPTSQPPASSSSVASS